MLTDPEFVRRWLTHRAEVLGIDAGSLAVVEVRPMSRGVSRQTWSVLVRDRSGEHPLMVRRDHPAGSVIPTSLDTEYAVYVALGATDIPHARALWWEDDPAWMPDGRPAYIREKVDGDWRLPALAADPADVADERLALAREHLTRLAQVHAVDWRAVGVDRVVPTPSSPARAAEELIDHLVAELRRYRGSVGVAAAEAVVSLRERAPRDLDRLVFCKGTNGHGEEVWRDGRIVAMSDWELAVIGDPAYDFMQCQELLADVVVDGHRRWGMPEALDFYAQLTGHVITDERLRWYRDLMALQQHVYTQHAAWVVENRADPPLRFVWTATEVAFRSELRLAADHVGDLLTESVA
ncbi:phosphotransferase family protein [Gordonia sp. zg691]|uniref:phosphotransferase family protein n=1 Tax=Gordonia jinghuaiqii TaxID=2758710 RepID=UPI0016624F63|nr:phosphotransferase family protein [Gordonia jinghuaiqii]MBD0859826.1 phosphotransferase family protein [Gordonia jinghuaiqii]